MMTTKLTNKLIKFSILLLTTVVANIAVHAQEIPLDKIAAVVNNDVVMFSEVKSLALQSKLKSKVKLSNQTLIKDALESLILHKIQLQRAKTIGIIIDDIALDKAMLSIAKQNNLGLNKFRIALIKEGHNYKEFRESIRDKLYLGSLQKRHQRSSKEISESEIDDLIQAESHHLNKDVQYHLIDILVPAPNGTSVAQFNTKLKLAQSLRKQLLLRASLVSTELIHKMGAKSQDLGWKSTRSISPAYVRTLSLLGVGELSKIVRDQKGFHILKLVEQKGGARKLTKQARVRHILISETDPQARVKAVILRNKILAGEDFSKLAKENSADKNSAIDGGNLGMMDPTSFVPPFAKAVTNLPLNSLSQPIHTQFGWHILEVMERKTTDQTREVLKSQAESLMTTERQTKEFDNWLQSLRDEAFVEYRINL